MLVKTVATAVRDRWLLPEDFSKARALLSLLQKKTYRKLRSTEPPTDALCTHQLVRPTAAPY